MVAHTSLEKQYIAHYCLRIIQSMLIILVCLFVCFFVLTGSEEIEYDIRSHPIRIEEREKDLDITGGIKCHVQKCLTNLNEF